MNKSNITWLGGADGSRGYTWSPTSGCSPVSAGCLNCWAKAYHVRYRGGDFSVKLHPEKLDEPLRLRKPSVIGVSLLGDLFHDDVPTDFIRDVFGVMMEARRHMFILLTKRPERLRSSLFGMHIHDGARLGNLWFGVSVEDQPTADARTSVLLDTPAAHRLVSYEPAIGPVDFSRWLRMRELLTVQEPFPVIGDASTRHVVGPPRISLVVQGCESGPRRRPFDVAWARSVRDQCKAAGVPYYLKQMPGSECAFQGPFKNGICEKPTLDGRQHLDLPWAVAP